MRLSALAAIVFIATASSAQSPTLTAAQIARIDSTFSQYNAQDVPGCAVGVSRHDTVVLERAWGSANLETGTPITPATIFEAGSVSKQFTAGAILRLVQQGKLSLDDDIRKYLPEIPKYDATITIRHMMNHTSGLRDWGTVMTIAGWPRGTRTYTQAHVLDIMSRQKALNYPVGAEYLYSNSNYNLLTLILEKITGQDYESFVRQNIWTPLGLSSTSDGSDMSRLVPHRATGTEPDGIRDVRLPRFIDWSGRKGSGSLIITASDLDRFVQALFGGKLLQQSSLERILAPAEGFAFGWARGERFGRKTMRSGGRSPGYNATVERYLDDGTTILILSNSYSPVAQDSVFVTGIHSAVFGKSPVPPSVAPVAVKPGSLGELAGQYQMPHDYFVPDATLELVDRGDRLDMIWKDGSRNTVYPTGPKRFLDRNFWAELSFNREGTGKVSGFSYHIGGTKFTAARAGRTESGRLR